MDGKYSMTITVSADSPEELAALLRRVTGALETGDASVPASSPPRRLDASGWADSWQETLDWYRRYSGRLVRDIRPDARRALRFIAEGAPAVQVDALAAELGKEPGPALAGTLASIGWWLKKHPDAPVKPFQKSGTRYEIDPELARIVLDAYES